MATLQDLHFLVEPEGRDLYLTPSPDGLQLLTERRAEFDEALTAYDDVIGEYPDIQKVAGASENDDAE